MSWLAERINTKGLHQTINDPDSFVEWVVDNLDLETVMRDIPDLYTLMSEHYNNQWIAACEEEGGKDYDPAKKIDPELERAIDAITDLLLLDEDQIANLEKVPVPELNDMLKNFQHLGEGMAVQRLFDENYNHWAEKYGFEDTEYWDDEDDA